MNVEVYRKKPVTVQMMLWDGTPEAVTAIQEWSGTVRPSGGRGSLVPVFWVMGGEAHVWNSEEGDWIACPLGHRVVRGPFDEFYPISPDALAATYDLVEV